MPFNTPGSYAADEVVGAANLNSDLFNNMLWVFANAPTHAVLYHDESTVIAGDPLSFVIDTDQIYNGFTRQDAAALNDQFSHKFWLAPGTYQVIFWGETSSTGGMFSIDIDGASVGDGFDTYSAAVTRNLDLLDGAGFIEITTTKVHTITVTVYDQNGASAGYGLRLTAIEFVPAAGEI